MEKSNLIMEKSNNPRSIRARTALRQAMLELIKDRPLDKIKVSEIAKMAGLYRMTFYNHYETKEDLLNDAIRAKIEFVLGQQNDYPEDEELLSDGQFDLSSLSSDDDVNQMDKWLAEKEFLTQIFQLNLDHLLIENSIDFSREATEQLSAVEGLELNPQLREYLITQGAYAYVGLLRVWVQGGMKESPTDVMDLFVQLSWAPCMAMMRENNWTK